MIIMKITLEYSLINTEYNENPENSEMTNIHVHVQTDLWTNKQADSPRPCSSCRINAVNSQLISNIWQSLLGLRINSSSHDYSLYPEQITKANILQSAGRPAPVDQGDKMSNAGKIQLMWRKCQPEMNQSAWLCISYFSVPEKNTGHQFLIISF